jgi:hypothetical protein
MQRNKLFRFGISGKARSGKNTTAEMIVKAMGVISNEYKIVALADPMKQIAEKMFPEAKKECLYGASELRSEIISDKYRSSNNVPLTYRQFLIDLGSFGRKYNDDIWLNCLVQDANRSTDIKLYIIADCRYINEFSYLKKSGYHMIRILRDECTKINDSSELEQDKIPNSDFDSIIENNSSMDVLFEQVKLMIDSL